MRFGITGGCHHWEYCHLTTENSCKMHSCSLFLIIFWQSFLTCQQYIIDEFEPDVFEALLRYLHTGSCHIAPSILPGLLCAAHCYEIPEVKQVCVDSIEECLDASMVRTQGWHQSRHFNSIPYSHALKTLVFRQYHGNNLIDI